MKRITFLIIILLTVSACTSLKTPEIRGVVVDAETGEPIKDARVYAVWYRVYSGPGGQSRGGTSKELRLRTKEDGTFRIPAFTLVNPIPYPFGQGGTFYMIVYAHGYRFKDFIFYTTQDFKKIRYKEFERNIEKIKVKVELNKLKFEEEYWKNLQELDVKDPDFDLEEYRLFIKKYPKSKYTPLAQYYIGYIYEDEIGNYKKAIEEYKKVIKKYPNTKAAKAARRHLELISEQ